MRKNAKQILALERERVTGGDGFLSAVQVGAKARGEVIEVSKKKKGGPGVNLGGPPNIVKGRLAKMRAEAESRGESPEVDEEVVEEEKEVPLVVRKDVITCKCRELFATHGLSGDIATLKYRSYAYGAAIAAAAKEVLRYYGSPRWVYRPKDEAAVQGHGGVPRCSQFGELFAILPVLHSDFQHSHSGSLMARADLQGPGGDQAYLALRGAQTSLK